MVLKKHHRTIHGFIPSAKYLGRATTLQVLLQLLSLTHDFVRKVDRSKNVQVNQISCRQTFLEVTT